MQEEVLFNFVKFLGVKLVNTQIFISTCTNKTCSNSQLNLSALVAAKSKQTMMQQGGSCY